MGSMQNDMKLILGLYTIGVGSIYIRIGFVRDRCRLGINWYRIGIGLVWDREEHLSAYNACRKEHAYNAYREEHLSAYNAS